MVFCHNCGKKNDDSTNFCIYCGTKLIIESIKCLNCGEINEPNSNFCVNCGTALKIKKETKKPTRQEAEKKAEELKKQINEKPLVKMSLGGKDIGGEIDKSIKSKLNQKIDDRIIEEYGTDDEIKELRERQRKEKIIKEKKLRISELYDQATHHLSRHNYQEAIKLFEEIINTYEIYDATVSLSFYELIDTYSYIGEYDKAFTIAEKQIQTLKQLEKDYSKVEEQIENIKKNKETREINSLERTGESLYYRTKFDEAIFPLKQAVELGSDRYQTFKCLSDIYLRKKELNSAIDVLKIGIERIEKKEWGESFIHNESYDGLKDRLENIEYFLEHGEFIRDCLPIDEVAIKSKIQEAKVIMIDDKEKAIETLEELMENGTFNNTVYYTLYQNYNKEKQFDDSIRVCEKAIDVLGFYDKDRKEKWTKYLNKAIEKKQY